jgi:hypothetical protein
MGQSHDSLEQQLPQYSPFHEYIVDIIILSDDSVQ